MVPSYLEKLYIAAEFPSGAGLEIEGYSKASRIGLRGAMGSITMSDVTWRRPLLIVENLHFIALSTNPEGLSNTGFIPNHHNLCAELTWKENVDTIRHSSFSNWLDLLSFKNPNLRILEISNGNGVSAMLSLTDLLRSPTPRFLRYTFADRTSHHFRSLQERTSQWSNYLDWKILNIEKPLAEQGFKDHSYDLIITHVVHSSAVKVLNALLKHSGRLLYMQTVLNPDTNDKIDIDVSDSSIEQNDFLENSRNIQRFEVDLIL